MSPRTHTILRRVSIILVLLVFCAYVYVQAREYIHGPSVSIHTPYDGQQVDSRSIIFNGVAKNSANITLNGRKIYVTPSGVFNEQLLLSYGYNILTLRVEGRYGKTVQKQIEVTYQ